MKSIIIVSAVASLLLVAACGGGENQVIDEAVFDTTGAAPPPVAPSAPDSPGGEVLVPQVETGHPIAVTLQENTIGMSTTIPPGPVVFTVQNSGTEQHSFTVEQQGGVGRRLDRPLDPGESSSMEVVLQAGPAQAFCSILDHASRGETLDIQVSP